VPFALTLNELVSNACKHRLAGAAEPVRVSVRQLDRVLSVRVSGGPASLPPGFDFAAGRGLGTGLKLVRILLPGEGASLAYSQEGGQVVAELRFFPTEPGNGGDAP
jgi:two-component sensor histidine kinase